MTQYPLRVGIMSEPVIRFVLHGSYRCNGQVYSGEQVAEAHLGHVRFAGNLYPELLFQAESADASFTLCDVTIGVGFHWQRKEDQRFVGDLRLIVEQTTIAGLPSPHDNLTAINNVGVEDYLTSVISSEMSATSSMGLLMAHAVTSRSWVLSPLMRKSPVEEVPTVQATAHRYIRFYERNAHSHFDVCADDHCQRYQGITRVSAAAENVRKAIEATWGQVLLDEDGEVCDARFYKCCGGRTEPFENVWSDARHYSYLECVEDSATPGGRSFCDTQDKAILSQVLNGYDQETSDFYRWQVHYTTDELSSLVHERSGVDYGTITDLQPIKLGPSGRIIELRIVGSKASRTIGKELEIRRTLSPSHLYSSAFTVEKTADGFTLHGFGWGHGVGLCQIGAAVMAAEGYDYRAILSHYFPHTHLAEL